MEIFTIVLASFFAVISPVGALLDKVVENFVRSRIYSVEQIAVRIDNTPSYTITQGHLDHLRLATRGIQPLENLRLEAVELETDPIDVNINSLQQGHLLESLRHPLEGALRLELKESDLNRALASPKIKAMLEKMLNKLVPAEADRQFKILEITGKFLKNNTFVITTKLEQTDNPQPLELTLESSLRLIGGHSLQLIEPSGTLNGRKLSSRLLKGFADGLNEHLDLRLLEKSGITVRVLQLKVEENTLYLAIFARLAPIKK